jgi:hypothetical protein
MNFPAFLGNPTTLLNLGVGQKVIIRNIPLLIHLNNPPIVLKKVDVGH